MGAIVLDSETTGLNDPQMVEGAYLKLADIQTLEVTEEFLQRYKPSKPIDLGALATSHIYDEELVDCPSHTEFMIPVGTEHIIGHNIDFDWGVIGQPDVKRICTKALSQMLWPDADSHSQSAMIYLHYRDQARAMLQGAHAALDDVRNCRLLLRKILVAIEAKYKKEPDTFEKLWLVSERARVPTVMRSGKFKGTKVSEIPGWHRKWLLEKPDTDPYLRKALLAN